MIAERNNIFQEMKHLQLQKLNRATYRLMPKAGLVFRLNFNYGKRLGTLNERNVYITWVRLNAPWPWQGSCRAKSGFIALIMLNINSNLLSDTVPPDSNKNVSKPGGHGNALFVLAGGRLNFLLIICKITYK